jgi:hypothetical protein
MNYSKVGNIILLILGFLTVLSGVTTLIGGLDPLLLIYDALHLKYLLGILKIIGGVLLVIKETKTFGVLFNSAYFGGAISSHLIFQSYDPQLFIATIILGFIWLGFYFSLKE